MTRRVLALLLTLVSLTTLSACSDPEPEPTAAPAAPTPVIESRDTGVRILLVGIDGATFSVIDPLVEAGELPTLGGMMKAGTRTTLESDRPMRSPALWTTVATGHAREEHGIVNFTSHEEEGGEPVLVNSGMRDKLNVWDMLGAAGRSVGVVGWWATWPAEPVRGFLISDRMTRSRWSEWTDGVKQEGLTYPAELAEELLPLVVDPLDPPMDEIRRIIDLDEADEAELLAAQRPVRAHGLSVLKFALSNQVTYERITDHLLDRELPDFSAVFLIANDAVSHTFWHYHQPQRFEGVDPQRLERLGPVVANVYRRNDDYLAGLLERFDSESTVTFVVSDHGFRPSGKLPTAGAKKRLREAFSEDFTEGEEQLKTVTVGQSGIHHPNGILIASGGPILSGSTAKATLFDLTPTILALMGMPVPEDLPGRVLTEIIDPEFLERFPVESVPTYERLIDRDALRGATGDLESDESTMEMLRSLGYIQ
jgi:predicted AlkP superfamily phosphohydrolase/phosphomutase